MEVCWLVCVADCFVNGKKKKKMMMMMNHVCGDGVSVCVCDAIEFVLVIHVYFDHSSVSCVSLIYHLPLRWVPAVEMSGWDHSPSWCLRTEARIPFVLARAR